MTAASAKKLTEGLRDNAEMIVVYREDRDSVTAVHRTFRADSAERFLRKAKTGKYFVTQHEAKS